MPREIKFRGKSVDSEKWIYGGIAISNDKYFIAETNKDGYISLKEVVSETVGQCTGLKDRNGAVIFEGDIIEFDEIEWRGKDNIHIISWDNIQGEWCWGGGNSSDMEFRKVVGNIYEHKYLLEI